MKSLPFLLLTLLARLELRNRSQIVETRTNQQQHRCCPTRQMERELADDRRAMHLTDDDDSNDSDELMHIRPGSGGTAGRSGTAASATSAAGSGGGSVPSARGKKIPDIYSDSDSTDRDKTDHTASDSQQHPFRTKAAMKEFNLQQEADRMKQKSPTKAGRATSAAAGGGSAPAATMPTVTSMALPVATPTSALPGAKVSSSTKLATAATSASSTVLPDAAGSKRSTASTVEHVAPTSKSAAASRAGGSSTKEGHTGGTKKKQAQQPTAEKPTDSFPFFDRRSMVM